MNRLRCSNCGTELTAEGVCPRCLLELGLQAAEDEATLSADGPDSEGQPASDAEGSAPSRIGPYELQRVLGEGGMGTVYLAEQRQPIARRVALKLVKPGMRSAEVLARFESERRALALMSHPHIARVLDAGTTEDGRPYFVMEYVEGPPITTYCDERRLGTRARLELLLPVCRAVQHAHQKGIIHRDLKPSNALVALEDGVPTPKVIDFGVAKAVEQRLVEQTLFTRLGMIVGTPEYMSPEQAEAGAVDIDTTTDIYSLGVLLYELLTGQLPFDPAHLRRAGYAEMQRIIREEEPPRPSTRVSALGEAATTTAASRRTDAPSLARSLRGDLDWIVLKCLEKDRSRRYPSATELAADLERHLASEPVTASPPSAAYRARKLVGRHKLGFAFAASLFVLLVAFGATMAVQSARTARERDRALEAEAKAQTEAETARRVTDFLVELFDVSDPSEAAGETMTAREVLDRAADRIDRELADQPEIKTRLLETLGRIHTNLGLLGEARPFLESALEAYERLFGKESLEAARALQALAALDMSRVLGGDLHTELLEQGEQRVQRALAIRRSRLGDRSLEVADSLTLLGVIKTEQQRGWVGGSGIAGRSREFEEARASLEEAVAIRRETTPPDELGLARSLVALGHLLSRWKNDYAGGEPLLLEALEIQRRLLPPNHPDTAWTLLDLGTHYLRKGDLAEAEPCLVEMVTMMRSVYGDEHYLVGGALNELAWLRLHKGQYAEAVALLREGREIAAASLGKGSLYWIVNMNLAGGLLLLGQLEDSERLYRSTSAYFRDTDDPYLAVVLEEVALLLELTGRLDAAEAALREGLASRLALDDPADRRLASLQSHLAEVLREKGSTREAAELCEEVVVSQLQTVTHSGSVSLPVWIGRPTYSGLQTIVGSCLAELGRLDEAERLLAQGLAGLLEDPLTPATIFRFQRLLPRAIALSEATGHPDEAERYRRMLIEPWRSLLAPATDSQ